MAVRDLALSRGASTNITGRLENWYLQIEDGYRREDGLHRIVGECYDDAKGRFPDGLKIWTSLITNTDVDYKEGAIIDTLYSTYLLGKERV